MARSGAAQAALIERIRGMLTDEPGLREVPMFGARAFMMREKMLVCALKHGALLVRVAAERHEELLSRAGATRAQMGPRGDMGPGWVEVDPVVIADACLGFWVDLALEHNQHVIEAPR